MLRLIGKAGVDVHKQVVLWCTKGEKYSCLLSSDKSVIIIIIIVVVVVLPLALYFVFRRVAIIVNKS